MKTPKTKAPIRKVASGVALGTPAAIVLAWMLSLSGLDVPPGVEAAMGALMAGAIAYLTPDPRVMR